jgi:hypothetical protein
MGFGYMDEALGVVPKWHKRAALAIGSAFSVIVVACIIIGLAVR